MPDFAIHFAIGTVASLALFLAFTWLSGARSFSFPSAVLFIGFSCGLLSHFLSPWATPAVLLLYALASANDWRNDRIAAGRQAAKAREE